VLGQKGRWLRQGKYGGKTESVPVARVCFSGKQRTSISTFAPSGPKCVTGDTLVLTDEGLRTMEEIYLSLEQKPHEDEFVPFETTVFGIEGAEKASKFYCGGFQPIYEVETYLGYTIRGTANHPLLTLLPGGETAWKKIGELAVGDHVALARGSHVFGQSAALPDSFYPLPRRPQMMSPELAYWLGLLTAEGSVTTYETWFVNGVEFTSTVLVTAPMRKFGSAVVVRSPLTRTWVCDSVSKPCLLNVSSYVPMGRLPTRYEPLPRLLLSTS